MDHSQSKDVKSKFEKAGFISTLFFAWTWDYYKQKPSHYDTVDKLDVASTVYTDQIDRSLKFLEKDWETEKQRPKPSFTMTLFRTFRGQFFKPWICLLCKHLPFPVISVFIGMLADHLRDSDSPTYLGYVYLLVITFLMLFQGFAFQQGLFRGTNVGFVMKAVCFQFLYKKTMKVSSRSIGGVSAGKLISLAGQDIEMLEMTMMLLPLSNSVPVVTLSTILLYLTIGPAALVMTGWTISILIMMQFIAKWQVNYIRANGGFSDERLKLLNNIIEGVSVLKMYAWDQPYRRLVEKLEDSQIKWIRRVSSLRHVHLSFFMFSQGFTFVLVFSTLVYTGHELQMGQVLAAIGIILSVQYIAIGIGSLGIQQVAKILAAANRITSVLLQSEYKQIEVQESKYAIEMTGLCASWENEQDSPDATVLPDSPKKSASVSPGTPLLRRQRTSVDMTFDTLRDLNVQILPGELVMIVGPVGAGKSSVFHAILSEMIIHSGSLGINGSIGYVGQDPWILASTLRDNIIMDQEYDEKRYEDVTNACDLVTDFNQLTHGDQTMIGDRGVNLSGGQKARVALARAVYSQKDILLLDDPLSAVDAHVVSHLFNDCICKYLSGRTRILITHKLHLLEQADKILCIDKGIAVCFGPYSELREHVDFISVIGKLQAQEEEEETAATTKGKVVKQQTETKTADLKTIVKEEQHPGFASPSLYCRYYATACNSIIPFLLIILFYILVQCIYLFVPYWVTVWTEQDEDEQKDPFYPTVLICAGFGLFLGAYLRGSALEQNNISSNKTLHNRMLEKITRVPLTFFDANPQGQIITKFSTDMFIMNDLMQFYMMDFVNCWTVLLGNFIIQAIVNPWISIGVVATILAVLLIVKIIGPVTGQLRKLEIMSKSPANSLLNQTVAGIVTLRAFGYQSWFADQYRHVVTNNFRAIFAYQACIKTFMLYTELSVCILNALNILILIILKDEIPITIIVFSLSFTVSNNYFIAWGTKQFVDTSFAMASVQRVFHYCQLEEEAALTSTQEFNPQTGSITFDNVSMKYREHLDYAIQNLNLNIVDCAKVGIVGRTGAGKSSILQVLSRLKEIDIGVVKVDGIDISSVGLHDLRKKITIIPQNPFLFSTTVRENLDPFDECADNRLWEVLEDVQLRPFFEELPDKLETNFGKSSYHLSAGQKQLLCLARAILRNNRILIVDEATANIDIETDKQIQQKIRERFSQCTVLTIAHRIDTIIDSDKILTMEAGTAVEYEAPYVLLQNPTSYFYGMVQALGASEAARMEEEAKLASQKEEGNLDSQENS